MKHIVFITNPISGTISKAGIPELVEVHLDHARFSYELSRHSMLDMPRCWPRRLQPVVRILSVPSEAMGRSTR